MTSRPLAMHALNEPPQNVGELRHFIGKAVADRIFGQSLARRSAI